MPTFRGAITGIFRNGMFLSRARREGVSGVRNTVPRDEKIGRGYGRDCTNVTFHADFSSCNYRDFSKWNVFEQIFSLIIGIFWGHLIVYFSTVVKLNIIDYSRAIFFVIIAW